MTTMMMRSVFGVDDRRCLGMNLGVLVLHRSPETRGYHALTRVLRVRVDKGFVRYGVGKGRCCGAARNAT